MRIFNFLINTNIYIAFAAVSLTMSAQVLLGMTPQWHAYLAVIFFATLFDYNFHRFMAFTSRKSKQLNEKYKWTAEHLSLLKVLIISSFIGLAIALLFVRLEILYILIPLALLSMLYSIYMSGKQKSKFRLQEITGLKTLMIAVVWTGATVFLPILQIGNSFNIAHIAMIFAERFAFIFAIAIPFDIRDMKADKHRGIRTIPLKYGPELSIKISNIALMLSLSMATIHYLDMKMIFIIPAYLISIISTVIIINNKKLINLSFYHHGLLDGCILLNGILILLIFFLPV